MIMFKTVYFCCDYLKLLMACYHSRTCLKAGNDFDLPFAPFVLLLEKFLNSLVRSLFS